MSCRSDDLSDAELLALAREGDGDAYGLLFKRHWHAGRAMAASITSRFEPDDLTSEAFTRILRAVEKGRGPKNGFRAYLATTIRNVAIDWSRRKTTPNIEDADTIEDWSFSEVTALERMERETIAKAFYDLPDSWQEVLWYTEVEDMAPREVAPLLGLTPNAVSALAVRAREGLRQSWINAHLAEVPEDDGDHAWVLSKLGSHVRGKLSRTDRAKVAEHLDECEPCANAAEEAGEVGGRLALGVLPFILGISGAATYLALSGEHTGSAVAATLTVLKHGPRPSLRPVRAVAHLRDLVTVGATTSHAGLGAVAAAVVAAAALTAGAVMSPMEPSAASARDQAGPIDPSPGAVPARQASPRAEESRQPESAAPREWAPVAESQPAPSDPAPTAPTLPGAAPSTEPEGESGDTLPSPPSSSPSPDPVPPQVTPEPPTEHPMPPVDGCEAAVRTIPAADTLFAYRLEDAAGATSASDFVNGSSGRYTGSPDQPGWSLTDPTLHEPTDEFTIQIRFSATEGGGRLIGFGSAEEGESVDFDRHLFLTDDGRLVFGVYPDAVQTITSPGSYLDGAWHQATATLSSDGMSLYVDGELVAHDGSVTTAQQYAGYWRVGYEHLHNWGPEEPSNWIFTGSLSYAAVYRTALTAEQIREQWRLCG